MRFSCTVYPVSNADTWRRGMSVAGLYTGASWSTIWYDMIPYHVRSLSGKCLQQNPLIPPHVFHVTDMGFIYIHRWHVRRVRLVSAPRDASVSNASAEKMRRLLTGTYKCEKKGDLHWNILVWSLPSVSLVLIYVSVKYHEVHLIGNQWDLLLAPCFSLCIYSTVDALSSVWWCISLSMLM